MRCVRLRYNENVSNFRLTKFNDVFLGKHKTQLGIVALNSLKQIYWSELKAAPIRQDEKFSLQKGIDNIYQQFWTAPNIFNHLSI